MKWIVFDVEGDGFNPTKIHVLSYHILGTNISSSLVDYDEMRDLLKYADVLVGHNITRFDIPVLERLLDIKIEAQLVDTLALSWYTYPRRILHGLADWGEEFGVPKPPIDDWENLPLEEYIHRCEEDVKINTKLLKRLRRDLTKLYGDWGDAKKLILYLQFKMDCAREQEKSGVKIDRKRVQSLLDDLEGKKAQKIAILAAAMPPVPVMAKRVKPAKPYKKDGTLSVTGAKWFAMLKREGLPEDFDDVIEVKTGEKLPKPTSPIQVKNWLFDLGWVPENFDYKRDKDTGDVRKIPQIKSDKGDGSLCPSVLALAVDTDAINELAGLSILNHRIPFLKGFLNNADDNDVIQAKIAGFTNTLRFKHKAPLANIPGFDAEYGPEIRSCLIAREGYEICGSDMSSLEDRTKLHYMFEYDPEYVQEMSVEGYDPHTALAVFAGELTPEQEQAYKDGDHSYKAIRHSYKTTNYACVYGAGAATVAHNAKCSLQKAEKLVEAYWKKNWSVKQIANDQKTKQCLGVKWLYNPVSKFWYWLKVEKDVFSTLNQGTGVFCFDTWVKNVRSKRPQLTAQFHDEIVLEVKKGHREQCEALLRWAITKTNEQLQLNRELDIDVEFGNNYAEVH